MEERLKKDKKIFYYARDHIMSRDKVFDNKFEALSYIGSAGTVETYKLKGNYYYFTVGVKVGKNKCPGTGEALPEFGALLPKRRIHKNHVGWLLGLQLD